jgi:hypothetical protein
MKYQTEVVIEPVKAQVNRKTIPAMKNLRKKIF